MRNCCLKSLPMKPFLHSQWDHQRISWKTDSHKEIKACRYWPASHTDTEEERNARSIPVVANPSTDTTAPLCLRWVGQSFIRNHRAQRLLSPFFAFQKGPHTVDRRTTRYWTYCRVRAANDKQAGILSCNQPKLHSCIHTDKRCRSESCYHRLISSRE